ncbi:hypothetical protein AB9P05_12745 [Roseivirga sp. BDSF3-8]|uniref:hypothetical protein n=1 Tax=Roseivirga sp. BDSF3-8 TaxID=3241598 RepID=UPI0035318C0E
MSQCPQELRFKADLDESTPHGKELAVALAENSGAMGGWRLLDDASCHFLSELIKTFSAKRMNG